MPIDNGGIPSARRGLSLKLRVFFVSLAWIALALAATGYVLNQLFEEHVRQQYKQQLQVYADYIVAGIDVVAGQAPRLDQSTQNPRFVKPLSGLYWQLNNEQGKAVLRSRSLWDEQLRVPSDALTTYQSHFHMLPGPLGKEVLLLEQVIRFESEPNQQWRLLVAEDAQALMSSIRDWQQMLVIFLLVLFASLGLAAMAQIVVGLSPLRRLQAGIARLRSGDSSRLEGSYPSEFSGLVDGFNGVLDANERMVERAKAQAGDLAHSLRTPLTVMSTALDQVQPGLSGGEELPRLFREQIATMRAQIDWQLMHARIVARSSGISKKACLVEPVVQQMLKVMRKLYVGREIEFDCELEQPGITFAGENQDLSEMLGNLLDNAGKWAKSRVMVRIKVVADQLAVEIEDDGPGVAADKRAEVLRRGVRMDERVPGSGLGLAIVDELVQIYQGSLELEASSLGGLLVRLKLPRL